MDEGGEDSVSSPFWLQSSTNHGRRRRSLSSFFLNSGLLIFLLCLTAVVFIFFVVPAIVSFTSQIFRPNLVKKSWDSVNIVLVLVALGFGFLSRNRNHDLSFDENHRNVGSDVRNEIQKSNPSTPRQWYEYSDRAVYGGSAVGGGLRRNSFSYPDLRDESPWVNADDRWRFSDDIRVEAHRYSDNDRFRRRRSWKRVDEEEEEEQQEEGKIINVDTVVTRTKEDYAPLPPSSPPHPISPAPPTSPPLTAVRRKPKRRYETIAHKEQVKGSEPTKSLAPPALTPPPPPPPPPPLPIDSEKSSSKRDRKRSGSNATKDLFTSIYNQKNRKKKQRQKSVDNFETLLQAQAGPPPPPPPPPPPSALHHLFSSKRGRSKKIISIPPPSTTALASKTTPLIVPIAARQPPLLLKKSNFQSVEGNSYGGGESPFTGCESPLIPIPPPPPPPPFKMRSWRFAVKGDYVRVNSTNSSRSVSPDDSPTSEISSEAGGTPTALDGGELVPPLFCPSPDVDTKAAMFIAKFRAGLKLQKMNSMIRQKHGLGLSNLGPETKPGPGPSQI